MATPLRYTPKQATKENIMRERQFEFAFEGINYYDLLRQGIDYAAAQLAKQNGVEVMTRVLLLPSRSILRTL